jgi:hypothetical protein
MNPDQYTVKYLETKWVTGGWFRTNDSQKPVSLPGRFRLNTRKMSWWTASTATGMCWVRNSLTTERRTRRWSATAAVTVCPRVFWTCPRVTAEHQLFVSCPHFLDADPQYRSQVGGLHPDPGRHRSCIVLEPVTGHKVTRYREGEVHGTFFRELPTFEK